MGENVKASLSLCRIETKSGEAAWVGDPRHLQEMFRLNPAEPREVLHMGKAAQLKVTFTRQARQEGRKVPQVPLLREPGKPCCDQGRRKQGPPVSCDGLTL